MRQTKIQQASWTKKYMLGIPIIDEQHGMFFDLYDKCVLAQQSPGNKDKVSEEILMQLYNYANMHFISEEKLMEKSGYKGFHEHKKEHDFFRKRVNEFIISHKNKNPLLCKQTMNFLKKWMLSHILNRDNDFKECVSDYLSRNPEEKVRIELNLEQHI